MVANRTALDALKAFGVSPDALIILTHDASLLDVLKIFPKADLARWEKQRPSKDIEQWRLLNDFLKSVLEE